MQWLFFFLPKIEKKNHFYPKKKNKTTQFYLNNRIKEPKNSPHHQKEAGENIEHSQAEVVKLSDKGCRSWDITTLLYRLTLAALMLQYCYSPNYTCLDSSHKQRDKIWMTWALKTKACGSEEIPSTKKVDISDPKWSCVSWRSWPSWRPLAWEFCWFLHWETENKIWAPIFGISASFFGDQE